MSNGTTPNFEERNGVSTEDILSKATNKEERIMEIFAANAAIGSNLSDLVNSMRVLGEEDPIGKLSQEQFKDAWDRMLYLQEIHPLTEAVRLLNGGEFNANS